VKLHRNAKTTPVTRALLITRVRHAGWSVATAATAQGISQRTAYKWLRRGLHDLEDHSSRPHRSPRRLKPEPLTAIIAARYERLSAWQIAVRLQIPRSTVSEVLLRAGVNRLTALTPRPHVQRYEYPHVGALLHLDMKRLARIGVIGHRIHGDRQRAMRGAGWETVHVCVDDHSRAAYVEVLADQGAVAATTFLTRAIRWFARRGVVVHRVLTDNGAAYRSHRFRTGCARLHLRHLRTRIYRPQTNGKAERFIQTALREWAYGAAYPSSSRRTRALRPWLRYYNAQRPHASLNHQPPVAQFPRITQ